MLCLVFLQLRNQVEQELRTLKAELSQRRSVAQRDNGQNSFRATATDAPVHWLHAKQTNKPIEGK